MDREFKPRAFIERSYQVSLQNIGDKLWETVALLENPVDILRYLNMIIHTDLFAEYAQKAAEKMVTALFVEGHGTWRQAAREASRGKLIYKSINQELQGPDGLSVLSQIERNATIIKTLPEDIALKVVKHTETRAMAGKRASEIAKEIKLLFPEDTTASARLIARTEVSKTNTALIRSRSERLEVPWYIWMTQKDGERVRESHRIMHGVLVAWNDPPSPEALNQDKRTYGYYHAGEIFNCRCFPKPLLRLDLIDWPHKVYTHGRIVTLRRSEFEKLVA